MDNLHIGTDGSHVLDTTDGAGEAVAAFAGSLHHLLVVGFKCSAEHGMYTCTPHENGKNQ